LNQANGRIPTGAAEVEWTTEEPPQDQQAPGNQAESVAAATLEYRRKCEARRRSEERPLKEMEEAPEWQAQLPTTDNHPSNAKSSNPIRRSHSKKTRWDTTPGRTPRRPI